MTGPNKTLPAGGWVEIGTVQIVGANCADRDQLARGGARDGHEHDEERPNGAPFPEQGHSGIREYKAGTDIGIAHTVRVGWEPRGVFHGEGSEAHGRRGQPGNRKPAEPAQNVAGQGVDGRGSNGLVVVTVVEEHSAKVACSCC